MRDGSIKIYDQKGDTRRYTDTPSHVMPVSRVSCPMQLERKLFFLIFMCWWEFLKTFLPACNLFAQRYVSDLQAECGI